MNSFVGLKMPSKKRHAFDEFDVRKKKSKKGNAGHVVGQAANIDQPNPGVSAYPALRVSS
jgi:hypothetical protein